MELEKQIKSLLFELGIPCIQKDVIVSPNRKTIHYNLQDITKLNDVQKKIKFLSAYLHIDITFCQSSIAHFALAVPVDNGQVCLNDKKYSYLFYPLEIREWNDLFKIFAGVDDNNNPLMIDLNENPHILVAGTTGSGKSVMINSIICSLIKTSAFVNFIMIDTKRVELAPYKKLKDCWVVNDIETALDALYTVCEYIDEKYAEMEKNGLRKIDGDDLRQVVVIEELGDLMTYNKKLVEKYIIKIARLGRACGVHLIVATQRPTTDVITGEIKANIGCRFALQTTSAIDSRNILGHGGAEHLKGKGDCLLKLPTEPNEIHLQCPYLSDEDIRNIIKGIIF